MCRAGGRVRRGQSRGQTSERKGAGGGESCEMRQDDAVRRGGESSSDCTVRETLQVALSKNPNSAFGFFPDFQKSDEMIALVNADRA